MSTEKKLIGKQNSCALAKKQKKKTTYEQKNKLHKISTKKAYGGKKNAQ